MAQLAWVCCWSRSPARFGFSSGERAHIMSVDGWPLATISLDFGGCFGSVTAFGCDCPGVLHLRGTRATVLQRPSSSSCRGSASWETWWGQLDNFLLSDTFCVSDALSWVCPFAEYYPFLVQISAPLGLLRACSGRPVDLGLVTWLILPVVICLSQRLSHACLSISNYIVKLRMAH